MALQRTRKTVIFHDGMSDGTDRYLLEPPSTDYLLNLHFTKDGSLQKRMGFGPDPLTTVPGTNGAPKFLSQSQGTLIASDDDSFHFFNGTDWTKKQLGGFIGDASLVSDSGPISGATHYAYQPWDFGSGVVAHTVACEVREGPVGDNSTEVPNLKVLVYGYLANGTRTLFETIKGAHSPKIVSVGESLTARHMLVYYQVGVGLRGCPIFPLSGTMGSDVSLGIDPSLQNRLNSHGSWGVTPAGYPDIIIQRLCGRLGEGYDWEAKYQVAGDADGLVVSWTERPGALDEIHLQSFTYVLAADSSEKLIYLCADQYDESCEVFDVVIGGANVHVLYSTFTSALGSPPESTYARLHYQVFLRATMASVKANTIVAALPNRTLINGSIVLGLGTSAMYAYTDGGLALWWNGLAGNQSYNDKAVRWPSSSVTWKEYDWSTGLSGSATHRLYHHRLVSNVINNGLDESGNPKRYALVQQWFDATPSGWRDDVNAIGDYVSILGALKPVSNVLVHLQTDPTAGKTALPVAVIGAGQSQCVEISESMMTGHKADLVLKDDAIWMCNRTINEAAGLSCWVGDADGFASFRTVRAETRGKSSAQVFRIETNGVSGATEIGDGVVVHAGMPTWVSRNDLSELSPIDSPEIVNVSDYYWRVTDGTKNTSLYYSEPKNIAGPFRKLNVVVGFTDSEGNIHRSAPSSTLYVQRLNAVDASTDYERYAGKEVSVYFTAPLSLVTSSASSWFAELYASKGVDDDVTLVASKSFIADSSSLSEFTIETQLTRLQPAGYDIVTPGGPLRSKTLVSSGSTKPLYTAGGVLAADPWPLFKEAVATSTRLWVLDAVNKGRVIPSKLFEDYIAPEYNASLAINLGDERALTAIGKLDDKVVVFEANDIHIIYGDGPDNRGQGNDFAVQYISTDVGCVDQESIVETPVGLIFYHAPRGFYLLDRSMQVQFIGAGIEDIGRGIDIVSATLVSKEAEVRFVFTGGASANDAFPPNPGTYDIIGPPVPQLLNTATGASAFVYNYEKKQWTMFSNYNSVAATMYQNRYTQLRSDWEIWQESEDRYDDPSGLNRTILKTPWIKLSEAVQDYTRIWQMKVLGRYLSSLQDMGGGAYEAGDLRIDVYYDYEPFPAETKVYGVQDFGYDPFNNPLKRPERFQLTIEPGRGRCQAIKLRFYETPSADRGEGLTYAQGRGFEITAVDFDLGISPMRPLLPAGVRR